MKETWMPIPGYEGAYSASNFGNIASHKFGRFRTLKPFRTGKRGDLKVDFCGHPRKTFYVARLVLIAFEGIDPERPEANHKNGNVFDNRIENLEWVTSSENKTHSYHVLGRVSVSFPGEMNPLAKLTNNLVSELRNVHKNGTSIRAISRLTNMDRKTISQMLKRRTWRHVN